MTRTPDRMPGPSYEEETLYDTNASPIGGPGSMSFDGTSFVIEDSTGTFDPRSGGGISESGHRVLRQLIHFIEDGPAEGFTTGAYKETLPTGNPFPTSEIWWESSSKVKKIIELTTTWTGILPTTEAWKIYDTDGSTVLATVTDTISYSGVFESNRTRAIAIL